MSETERAARAIMAEEGCGYTLNGEHVLCDDTRLLGVLDPYGEPLRRGDCSCRADALRSLSPSRNVQ